MASPQIEDDAKQSKGPSNTIDYQEPVAQDAIEVALETIDDEYAIDSKNSPVAEVRANVANTDEIDMPVNTIRMWFLGIVFTMVN
jgi:hypothetical protein